MIDDTNTVMVYTHFGPGIAFGIYGTKEVIETNLNGLYNYGGHSDKITFLSDSFGYILTTRDKLLKGLQNWAVADVMNIARQYDRNQRKVLFAGARQFGADVFKSIAPENFLAKNIHQHLYTVRL